MKRWKSWMAYGKKALWAAPLLLIVLLATLFAQAADQKVAHAEYHNGESFDVFWIDNNDEENTRPTDPGAALQPKLSFTLDGKEYDLSDESQRAEALALIGLTQIPQATVDTSTGVGHYTVSFGSSALPSRIWYESEWDPNANDGEGGPALIDPDGDPETGARYSGHEITWTVEPADVSSYAAVHVTEDDIQNGTYDSVNDPGWYYVQETEVAFTIALRWGTMDELLGISDAVGKGFSLEVLDTQGTDLYSPVLLAELLSQKDENGDPIVTIRYYRDGDALEEPVDPVGDDPDAATYTIHGAWKYNLDSSLITYRMAETAEGSETGDGRLDGVNGLDEGDYFAISYDNSGSAGHGTSTDAAYDSGTIYLTLTGATHFEGTKEWLEPERFDITVRPEVAFHLYRYREGQDVTSAAPVWMPDENGTEQPVIITLTDDQAGKNIVAISYGQEIVEGELSDLLPKYDSEGYEYIYVVREIMSGGRQSYEQVFGRVDEDGNVEDTLHEKADTENGARKAGDTFLYSGGTLSNRVSASTTQQAAKVWNAAAFQAEFDKVSVELTLYCRENDSNDDWEVALDTSGKEVIRTLDGFTAENLAGTSLEVSVPVYGPRGETLEYEWRETAVIQGTNHQEIGEDGTFTLSQSDGLMNDGDREMTYTFESRVNSDGITVITNTVSNEITYTVEKVWLDENGTVTEGPEDAEVVFSLYRLTSGQAITDAKPYLELKLTADEDTITRPADGVTLGSSTEEWTAILEGLPEFDENGRQYQYVLLETRTAYGYTVGSYETTRNENRNYTTRAINGPGGGNRILVQKTWIDDTDAAHREPVTIQVYDRDTGKPIEGATATLGKDDSGVWYALVGIGTYEVNNVYVVETGIGSSSASDLPQWSDEDGYFYSGANDSAAARHTITTDHHRYEVTYSPPKPVNNETVYNINNRRLGNVDVTVTKEWRAGDNTDELAKLQVSLEKKGYALALKLAFHPSTTGGDGYDYYDYVIDYDNNTVQVGGPSSEPVEVTDGLIQTIEIPSGTSTGVVDKRYTFGGLPKYDATGTIVRYTVEEVLVDASTKAEVTASGDLAAVLSQWRRTVEETSYSSNDTGDTHDTHAFTAANTLTGTTDVSWYKEWKDAYSHENGTRPDIYLDIYQEVHTGPGSNEKAARLIIRDYLWTSGENAAWTATISDLPKYDSYGYEIRYFAVERTAVNAASFDYQPVKYSVAVPGAEGAGTTVIDLGTREALDGTEDAQADYIGAGYVLSLDGVKDAADRNYGEGFRYALGAGGTFTNTIQRDLTYTGRKLWTALPSGFAMEDLPDVTFTLYQILAEDAGNIAADENGTYTGGTSGTTYQTENGDPAASLTVTDWSAAYQNGSYQFQFTYLGKNTMTVQDDGTVVYGWDLDEENYPEIDSKTELPKYDGEGSLYTYTLQESEIAWEGDDKPHQGLVFADTGSITPGTFVVDNVYDSVKGDLAVKKILQLPMNEVTHTPLAYPSVTFQLSRTYTPKNVVISEPEIVATVTWSAAQVQEDYKASGNTNGQVTWEYIFQDQEIYAPNGSEYQYTITEVKTDLGDYDTQVYQGRAESAPTDSDTSWKIGTAVGNLVPDPDYYVMEGDQKVPARQGDEGVQERGDGPTSINPGTSWATFYNERVVKSYVTLRGVKTWNDWEDLFGFRPGVDADGTIDGIAFTVTRSAASQPGQNNPVETQLVPEGSYTVTWSETEGDYTFTIRGPEGVEGKAQELERYAPNGMPWTYTVREEISVSPYTASTSTVTGTWSAEIDTENTGIVQLHSGNSGNLTNSIQTSASYRKQWQAQGGGDITEDYLDGDITVEVELQVAELTSADAAAITDAGWQDAADYFQSVLNYERDGRNVYSTLFDEYAFTAELTAPINDADDWNTTRSFSGLPRVIVTRANHKNGSNTPTYLVYRVVETEITYSYQNKKVICTVLLPDDDTMGTGTQRLTYIITTNPATPTENNSLFTGAEGSYTVSNSSSSSVLTNTMRTTSLTIYKVWAGDSNNAYHTRPDNNSDGSWDVSFLIQYSTDGSDWHAVRTRTGTDEETKEPIYAHRIVTISDADSVDSASVTVTGLPMGPQYRAVELQPGYTLANGSVNEGYIISWDSSGPFHTAYTVSYAYTAPNEGGDTQAPDSETPDAEPSDDNTPDSPETGGGTTPEETPPTAAVRTGDSPDPGDSGDASQPGAEEEGYVTTVTNTLETTARSAQKNWQVPDDWAETHPKVTLSLQYLAGENPDDDNDWVTLAQVKLDGKADTAPALPYYEDSGWHAVWKSLPVTFPGSYLLNADSKTQYRVVEEDLADWLQVDADTSGDEPVFTNTPATSLTVRKQWSSVPGQYAVVVDLYRTTDPDMVGSVNGDAVPVSDTDHTQRTLTLTSGSWSGTFTGLPVYNESGALYHYYALERTVDGVTVNNSGTKGTYALGGVTYVVEYQHAGGSTTITNSVLGERTVQKIWRDNSNADGSRPISITVQLYQGGNEYGGPVELSDSNSWTYTWTGLKEYDSSHQPITYSVREISATLPDGTVVYPAGPDADGNYTLAGYEVTIQGYTITNTKRGNLDVTKTVSGLGDPNRDFHFTVTLNDKTINGAYGEMTFTNGVADFTLKHGETVTAEGLPAGITYTVTEAEANQDGYSTTYTNASGTIPVAETAHAAIFNHISTPTPDSDPDPGPSTTTISGTKTWVDDSDAAGLRPDSLELTLYRSSDGGRTWTRVSAVPTWNKSGSVWRYTYSGLDSGYTYRVEETVPEGYTGRQSGYHFTNTLSSGETVDIPVEKIWEDSGNAAGYRPGSITVVLYADGEEIMRQTLTEADGWSHIFQDLPKYGDDGAAISYTVAEENVPAGYSVRYDGTTIINTAQETETGSLTVRKTVTGTGGDPSRLFTFTVTLGDRSINGTYGGMTFTDGVATFTLSHGESMTAAGLPAGITYEVTEAEANQDGYDTTASGAMGTISAEGATASYVNHRDTPDDTPDTGDPTRTGLWLALCLASLAGAALLLAANPRRGKRMR